jgi:NAD(P)-dependent dehydrogenase (short-subunit alcohol dehydrogenase family)
MGSLAQKVALITGAASGIGRAMARRFAAEGAAVMLADLQEDKLTALQTELEAIGASVGSAVVDIALSDDVERMIKAAIEQLGGLDILCNNAGVLDNLTPLHDTDEALFDKVMAVNIKGPFLASRAAVRFMRANGGGAIINTASAAGTHGGRGGSSYTASKHALIGLTRSIAWYYGPEGIRCNAICPGAIMTAMASSFAPHPEGFARYQDYFSQVPPFGRAADVGDVATFLASDEARYINGAIVPVDGGWVAF